MEQDLIEYEPPMIVEVGTFNELTRATSIGSTPDNKTYPALKHSSQE